MPPANGEVQKQMSEMGRSMLHFLGEHVIGVNSLKSSADLHKSAHADNPNIRDEIEDQEAVNEHVGLQHVSLLTSPTAMIESVSLGVSWFFNFLQHLWFVYFVLTTIGVISYGKFFSGLYSSRDDSTALFPSFPQAIYVSAYDSSDHAAWLVSSAFGVVFMFCVGPVWARQIDNYHAKRARGDLDYVEDPFEGEYNPVSHDCTDKIEYPVGSSPTPRSRIVRRIISAFVFIVALTLSGVINYVAQQYASGAGQDEVGLLISALIAIINFLWEIFCTILTRFEHHQYHSEFRKWECVKLFVFKVANVCVMFFAIRISFLTTDVCSLESMAHTFLYLLAVNYIVSLLRFVQSIVEWKCCQTDPEKSRGSNDDSRPEFILSIEYVEQLYRLFIVCLGFFVCPLLPLFAMYGNFIEYWLIKYRMLRVHSKPRRTASSYKHVLLSCTFMMACCSLATYPNGAVWILSSYFNSQSLNFGYESLAQKCPVFR